MILAKNRAFKIQIRERTTHKKMAKVRLNYQLKDNPTYESLLDQLLALVAHCRFSSPKINTEEFQKIIQLVQKHQYDWNASLLIYHQFEELNLISMACMKYVPQPDLFYLSKLLFLNKQYLRIDREDWKELIAESRQNCLQKCKGPLFTRVVPSLTSFFFEANKNGNLISENQIQYSNDQILLLEEISKKVEGLNCNLKQQFPFSESEYAALVCQTCGFLSNNIWMTNVALNSYLNVLTFLMGSIQDQRGENSPTLQNLRSIISGMLISFEQCDEKKRSWEDHIVSPLTLVRLLQFCKLDSPKYTPFVNICLLEGISENFDPDEKFSIHSQCLHLLLKISFEQEWICYTYFQPFFEIMIKKIEQFDSRMSQNFKNNIFNTKSEDQVLKYERTHHTYEISIIKIIENLIYNEYKHVCGNDFYSFLSALIQDFINLNVFLKWSRNPKLVETLQSFVNQLLGTKNQDQLKYLLNVFHVWIGFDAVDQNVKKKILGLLYLQQKSDERYLEYIENYQHFYDFEDQMFSCASDGSYEDNDDLDF